MFGCSLTEATEKQVYRALCTFVRESLEEQNRAFQKRLSQNGEKKVYYMSMEFLVGTSLRNNLYNLGILDEVKTLLEKQGFSLDRLCGMEPDAGLGNGGLGRLASCYMDAATGLGYSVTGYSIRYEFGIFRQKIVDGWQMEFPDDWLDMGGVWLHPRKDDAVEVRFGGEVHEWTDETGKFRAAQVGYQSVTAVPHDMYISGYDSSAVNRLILWSASQPHGFDMAAFSRGDYVRALEQNTMAETISKVLYPADDHISGKRLRLRQQYLLVSASLQSIVKAHLDRYRTLKSLPEKVAIHINDTHPALCVPELMRLLIDEYDMGWDEAWDICCRTLSYTNHTVMSEALERWSVELFREQLPRIFSITQEINRRLLSHLAVVYPNDPGKWDYMAVIANGEVRMANLCLACCHMVNGVSRLHTQILETGIFRDYYNLDHDRFTNVTNGIAYRRWLCQANPALTGYLRELIGDGFMKDANQLEKLLKFQDDKEVLAKLHAIKRTNKQRLADYIAHANGVVVDPDSLFDVQVKRLHEYKRQLLNVMHILYLYQCLQDDPTMDFRPQTFLFGAKAAPGYAVAKRIIRLIGSVADQINHDPVCKDKLQVVFLENYRVSMAEMLMPASEVSQQISTAGKEASGTGNMKFMMNGAVTIGTLDGANVEMHEVLGDENMFLFGLRAEEAAALSRHYDPELLYERDPVLRRVLDAIRTGFKDGVSYEDIYRRLLFGGDSPADQYLLLADFVSYCDAGRRMIKTYGDRKRWNEISLHNIARSGIFAADRSIRDYAEEIWHVPCRK